MFLNMNILSGIQTTVIHLIHVILNHIEILLIIAIWENNIVKVKLSLIIIFCTLLKSYEYKKDNNQSLNKKKEKGFSHVVFTTS